MAASCALAAVANIEASGADFTGRSFTESDLDGANLADALFVSADLSKADFTEALRTNGDFTGADLTGTIFDFWHPLRHGDAFSTAKGKNISGPGINRSLCRYPSKAG